MAALLVAGPRQMYWLPPNLRGDQAGYPVFARRRVCGIELDGSTCELGIFLELAQGIEGGEPRVD
ncbi:MAG: hypothetical protein AAB270_06150, partial [Chloroflexota bacterium]